MTGICQYLNWSEQLQAAYISVNMFRDITGDRYAKPIYVERSRATLSLEGICQKKLMLGKTFYSLIKDTSGHYIENHQIYRWGKDVLGLEEESKRSFGFKLLKTRPNDIKQVYEPVHVFEKLSPTSKELEALKQYIPEAFNSLSCRLGLIGSLAVDSMCSTNDIDVVFTGTSRALDSINQRLELDRLHSGPQQVRLAGTSIKLCAFYSQALDDYKDFESFSITSDDLMPFNIKINSAHWANYLNVQRYSVTNLLDGKPSELIVRDTLGRWGLAPNQHLILNGFPGKIGDDSAILVTDVETQIKDRSFHGPAT